MVLFLPKRKKKKRGNAGSARLSKKPHRDFKGQFSRPKPDDRSVEKRIAWLASRSGGNAAFSSISIKDRSKISVRFKVGGGGWAKMLYGKRFKTGYVG